MTTENIPQDEVSASEESVSAEEEIAEQVLAGEKPPEVEQKPAPTPPLFDADELIARVERTVQGRTANTFGQFRKEMRAEIEAALAPVRDFTSRIEQAQVEQLEPEQQVEYWRQKAQTAQKAPEPAREREPQQQSSYTSQEQQEISASVSGMLELAGLDIAINDSRLWEGYQQGDSPARIRQIARQNIRKLQGEAPKPAAAEKPAPEPVKAAPSTSGAPRRSASTITTAGDLYRIFSDPNDQRLRTNRQLMDALNQQKKNGKVTL